MEFLMTALNRFNGLPCPLRFGKDLKPLKRFH